MHERKKAGRAHAQPAFFNPAGSVGRLGLRKQAFTLGALAGQLARAAHGLGLLAGFTLRGLLEVIATLHFAEETFTLHLFLERLQRLIDVVIADHDLNYLKLSIGFPAGPGDDLLERNKRRNGLNRSLSRMRWPARRVIFRPPPCKA